MVLELMGRRIWKRVMRPTLSFSEFFCFASIVGLITVPTGLILYVTVVSLLCFFANRRIYVVVQKLGLLGLGCLARQMSHRH